MLKSRNNLVKSSGALGLGKLWGMDRMSLSVCVRVSRALVVPFWRCENAERLSEEKPVGQIHITYDTLNQFSDFDWTDTNRPLFICPTTNIQLNSQKKLLFSLKYLRLEKFPRKEEEKMKKKTKTNPSGFSVYFQTKREWLHLNFILFKLV